MKYKLALMAKCYYLAMLVRAESVRNVRICRIHITIHVHPSNNNNNNRAQVTDIRYLRLVITVSKTTTVHDIKRDDDHRKPKGTAIGRFEKRY